MASSNEGDNRATQGGVAAFSAAPESLQALASRQLPALQTAPVPPMSDLSNVKVLRVAAAPLPQRKPGDEVTADTSLPPHAAEVAVAVNTAAAGLSMSPLSPWLLCFPSFCVVVLPKCVFVCPSLCTELFI